MMKLDDVLEIALFEDLGKLKDITSRAIFNDDSRSNALIIAKEGGVISGIHVVTEVFRKIDPSLDVHPLVADGDLVSPFTEVFVIKGKTISILEGERVALNYLSHLSGISTTVHEYTKAVEGTGVHILDTRKTIPGLRELEKYAVVSGGGKNHRMGLYDRILIKDNHIEGAGGIPTAVESVREMYGEDFFIEVEAQTMKEVEDAIRMRVDRILLDNMTIPHLREAVRLVNGQIPLEASGNVGLDTVRSIAETGVQYISVGALTLSSKALDLSLRLK